MSIETDRSTATATGQETSRVVYGYLRAPVNDQELSALRLEITDFCRKAGYQLASVFVDRQAADDQLQRPGFGGLLDVLVLPGTYGVVIPSLWHLSAENAALAQLRRLIRRTGSEVIVVRDVEDTTKVDGA